MRANLKSVYEPDEETDQEQSFEEAMRLVDATAKLSEALAKVKSEMRQMIRVERSTKSTAIAPQSAPNDFSR